MDGDHPLPSNASDGLESEKEDGQDTKVPENNQQNQSQESVDMMEISDTPQNVSDTPQIVYENLQWQDIGIYIRYHMTEEECNNKNYKAYLPKKKVRRGKFPKFTGNGSSRNEKNKKNSMGVS